MRTVTRIKAEALRAPLSSPKRKKLDFSGEAGKRMTAKTRLLRYDTFALAALRRKVHSYFMRNELPTSEKLRNDVISDPDMDMPTISTRTMQRMLNDLGAEGFVDGAALVFRAKKGAGDYHTEMDAPRFQNWFVEQLLPNIKPRSVIVMDNTSCHSAQVEKVPSSSSRKADIQCWLKSKSIPFSDDQLKSELLQLVKQHKHMFLAYQIDTLASAAGHEVVHLPPYHCELNPIELVWSQVKGYVASKNTDFKIDSVEKLLLEGIAGVTPQNWFRDCTHVIRLEDEAWERDGIIDSQRESLIISLGTDSSTSDESSSSDMSGIDELS
ncbi:uncharacterized protein LOC119454300 [Dermacentor silvarum]|uniref:uncharacterized protein LOC119454300 n=1 Tax=Dermacentor silvarum TaxID=543639 RepID=UPI0018975FBC|nr:uncharacterized protein LOC119454300 [Dermacentor silvarum]